VRFVAGGEVPATRFAWVGEDRIAYQVLVAGSGFEFDDRGDHELKRCSRDLAALRGQALTHISPRYHSGHGS